MEFLPILQDFVGAAAQKAFTFNFFLINMVIYADMDVHADIDI